MKRILIVEDDIFLAKYYSTLLKKAGYLTEVLFDGLKVIDTVKNQAPDLIILDLVMPHKDGFEVLEDLKSKFLNKIPVLILTQLASDEDRQKVGKYGLGVYMVKMDVGFKDILLKVKE